jgi:hypothetical protein
MMMHAQGYYLQICNFQPLIKMPQWSSERSNCESRLHRQGS